jgi:ATP-dependent exoDNAse (exonuclease V) beta subunit
MSSNEGKFEIVRASAGSGKTYRLVLRYLECALKSKEPGSFRRILALTFTNKAAAEMKSRILNDLKNLVDGESDKLKELSSLLKLSEDDVVTRAESLHKEMLHRYSDISVMTIDRFVNRLVKSFARDLAIDQDYRIEIDSDKVIEDAVSQLLDKIGTQGNESLTKSLESFALQQVIEDEDAAVRRPLTSLGKTLVQEKMKPVISALSEITPSEFQEISMKLRRTTSKAEKKLYSAVDSASVAIRNSGIPLSDFPKNNILKQLYKIKHAKLEDPKKTLENICENSSKMLLKGAADESKIKAETLHSYILNVRDALVLMRPKTEEGKEYMLAKSLNKRMSLLGALAALHQEIENVQIDNNIRTFHAMHERIAEIVKENPAPFIYERLGSRYNHIFMDEFQDTSVTQWHNLVVLYDHAIGNNNKTLVVGDGKQAIYRFRNGDYKQLLDLPNLQPGDHGIAIKDAEETLKRSAQLDSLDENWRSGRNIVDWNNKLFSSMSKYLPSSLEKVYDGLEQIPMRDFNGGVHLDLVIESSKEKRRKIYTEKIIERIDAYKAIGFELGDITILVRENQVGALLAQDLLERGIKPMTEESLQLGRHPGPLAVVALMRWMLRPADYRQSSAILQCTAALRAEYDPINEGEIMGGCIENRDKKTVFDTRKMLNILFPNLEVIERSTGPLAGFIGHLCEEMGLTEHYPSYAEGLLELAREVSGSDESGLHGFLRVWDSSGYKKSVVTGKSNDSVQIMTVHKAKGLDFKIAIILVPHKTFTSFRGIMPVDMDDSMKMPITAAMMEDGDMKDSHLEDQRLAEIERVQLDAINGVYVAFTRPVERLDILLEFEREGFDEPKTMPQLIMKSLEDAFSKGVTPGEQTENISAKLEKESREEEVITQPVKLHTGEKVEHLVSIPPSETNLSFAQKMSPRELGSAVHGILERINTSSDWQVVKKSIENGMAIGLADREIVFQRVESIIFGEQSAEFFTEGLLVETEVSFIDSNGEIIRPDRIIRDSEGWTVIDYKSSEQDQVHHLDQIKNYMNTLSEIEGQEVKGILIYTDPLKVLKVA